jgi:hypothetical protein
MCRKKNTPYIFRLRDTSGTIMVGIVVLIVLSAIAFSTALYVLGDAIQLKRATLTMERLRAVEAALIGHPHAFLNDATSHYGYFSRQNALTTTIGNLTDLQNTILGLSANTDAYGHAIQLSNAGGTYSIYSIGNNNTDEGGGGDDIAIEFPSATRTSVDISVMIVDATQSGNHALTFSGVSAPMMSNSYIYDQGSNNSIDGPYDGHVVFGPVFSGTLADSDISVTLHTAPSFEGGAGVAPDRFDRASASFQWDDVPIGVHLLRIDANPDNDGFDPQWEDSGSGSVLNRLMTPLFINPTATSIRRQFNVMYPVIAAAESLSGAGEGIDQTVTDEQGAMPSDREVFTALSNADSNAPFEYLAAGYGSPDYYGYTFDHWTMTMTSVTRRRMRSLLSFDLTALPGLSATSKVSFAQLHLSTHVSAGSGLAGATWTSSPRGSGTIEIYRFLHAWTEVGGSPTDVPVAQSWNRVDDAGTDYSDRIAQFDYAAGAGNYQEQYVFDVLHAVQNWVRGVWDNYGFLILNTNDDGASGDNWWCFSSKEAGDADAHPKLIVCYYP